MVNLPLIASFEVNRRKKTKPTKINKVVSCYYFKYKIGSLKLLKGKDTVQRKTKIFFATTKLFICFFRMIVILFLPFGTQLLRLACSFTVVIHFFCCFKGCFLDFHFLFSNKVFNVGFVYVNRCLPLF